ncbi:hypothetical protein SAMN02746041_02379 [Desulfacinum hydrothermale DSM 13146]|uniref:Uncharacterized protein n=1 Tax=Desulfacinum hydrothermale DSM 13146 TaxID=1121390 RepID=A0A1W1XQ09_9BACT|nr:hypothetical protein [Desulfacinum hydrothermale]SMC25611.1 hypothetical protein SAMN02746041_02379 [Desulfacinum hydrothermale DSM 13146]
MAGVIVFRPYPLKPGQKISIEGGPRNGDWQVVEVSERKVRLRCPVTHKEVEWDRFCYLVEESEDRTWPMDHSESE